MCVVSVQIHDWVEAGSGAVRGKWRDTNERHVFMLCLWHESLNASVRMDMDQ